MRWIANYLRQCFCRHEWEMVEGRCKDSDDWGGYREGVRVAATCKVCGYHRSYWKF